MDSNKQYSVDVKANYIYLKFVGAITIDDLKNSTEDVLRLAEEQKVEYLLDDIRELDTKSVNMHVQTQAIANLWKLRSFKKIALVFGDQEVGYLVLSTLQTLHFPFKCQVFDSEVEAIQWLKEE